jgi:hypothetical protein
MYSHPDALLGQSMFLPLAIIGGAGWKDGLLIAPLTGAVLAGALTPMLRAIYLHPRYQAFKANHKTYDLTAALRNW